MATSTEHDDCATCDGERVIRRVVNGIAWFPSCPDCEVSHVYDGPDEAVDFSTINWRWRR